MAEKESGKSTRGSRPVSASSEDYPVTSPQSAYSSGDYTYTVELVGTIQHQLGKLTEAVETLKAKAASANKELRDVAKDVHTAKVVVGIVGGIVTLIATFLGIALKAYLDHLWRYPAK